MKVAFILPAIGKKKNKKYLRSWLMEPLTIAVLNKLTPPHYKREFYDDRIEAINYETDADVIAITVETYTAKRAYAIAKIFKAKGKTIIMGGYHATLMPEEAMEYCDVIICGNAETIWTQALHDIENESQKKIYQGGFSMDYGLPDRSIYLNKIKKYLPISLVEVGRGCRHNCEFCSINAYYRGCYIHRKIEHIIDEIKQCKNKIFFLVDDSIFSDKKFAKKLFEEIKMLKIIWTTQITLDFAKDKELLRLMKDSGCEMVLIGFESVNPENLKQMNKEWSVKIGERDELVKNVHDAGISIYASFVFGFDYDSRDSFEQVLKFSLKHNFFVVAYNHLLTFPNTKTYENFEKGQRLLSKKWWLADGYTFGSIFYKPNLISSEGLQGLCMEYKRKYYNFKSIFKRGITLFKRTKSFRMNFIFWAQNILFHYEVDKRFGIPVGENLDEAKK